MCIVAMNLASRIDAIDSGATRREACYCIQARVDSIRKDEKRLTALREFTKSSSLTVIFLVLVAVFSLISEPAMSML